jgi:tight adherence protein C
MSSALLVALCGAAAAFLLAFSFIPARNPLAERIEKMQRVNEPSHAKRMERFAQILAGEPSSRTRARLAEAGWYRTTPATLALRSLGGLGVGVAVAVVLMLILPNRALALGAGAGVALLAARLPKIALDRAIVARKNALERELPDFLDILSTTVQAGLALSAALIQAADATRAPLQDELRSALAEIRLGRPRGEALAAMAERTNEPQIRSMVTSIVQAESLGANIAEVLRELAIETRNRRWMRAEERAAQLPIKMLFPMALLMLPALYVMIFGPVAAELTRK